MTIDFLNKSIYEEARKIKVVEDADVVVVGGGPGGVGAAISAARNGANTVLIERYGYLGGMSTGGLVNILPHMSDINGRQCIGGVCQEIIERLDSQEAVKYPSKEEWGTSNKKILDFYVSTGLKYFFIRRDPDLNQDRLLYSAVYDPEILKNELNKMMKELNIKVYLHSWGAAPILEDNSLKGIIFESKSGRLAALGKVIIDSTGDGDIFIKSGVEYDNELSPLLRTSKLAMVFWLDNVNLNKFEYFKTHNREKYDELMVEIKNFGGFPEEDLFHSTQFAGVKMQKYFRSLLKNEDRVLWSHPMLHTNDSKDVEELTRLDMEIRDRIIKTYQFMKRNLPGFENSYIRLTAPQLGIQGGRRIIGEYMLSEKDRDKGEIFEDTIATFPNLDAGDIISKIPTMNIPYRTMIPRTKIKNLIVACRAYSTTDSINHSFNLIPFCLALGQAAGTAAALAVSENIQVRSVNYKRIQTKLTSDGVILPKTS